MTTLRTLLVMLVLLAAPITRAAAWPWVPLGDDVRLVADAKLDVELRLFMIQAAQSSVDVVTYEQGEDPDVGLRLLAALRGAAMRGVRVRLITGWLFQYLYQPFNRAPEFLTNPPARAPVQYRRFGVPEVVVREGWEPSDGIHSKLLVIDGKWALTTGRGHTNMSLREVDATFALKGALVEQTTQAYEALWHDAETMTESYAPRFPRAALTAAQRSAHGPTPRMRLNAAEQAELAALVTWLVRPSAPVADGKARRGRLLHFDFVRQMHQLRRRGATPRTWQERLDRLHDPIETAFVQRVNAVADRGHISFTSMYPMLTGRVRNAIVAARRRGAQVRLFANAPLTAPPITTLAWLASAGEVAEVSSAGVDVFLFNPPLSHPHFFDHLKLAVMDDAVLFGSHNLNLASSAANDEINYEIEDAELAQACRRLLDERVTALADRYRSDRAQLVRPVSVVIRALLRPILGFW